MTRRSSSTGKNIRHQKKVLAAFKGGLYVPKTTSEKRRLEGSLEEHEVREKKARVMYERTLANRSSA